MQRPGCGGHYSVGLMDHGPEWMQQAAKQQQQQQQQDTSKHSIILDVWRANNPMRTDETSDDTPALMDRD